jgi:hypothetical protein
LNWHYIHIVYRDEHLGLAIHNQKYRTPRHLGQQYLRVYRYQDQKEDILWGIRVQFTPQHLN